MPKTLYQVAILVDAGFLLHELYPLVGHRYPTADEIISFCDCCLKPAEERLFRIYYYDCKPLDGRTVNPISGAQIDFGATATARSRKSLQDGLAIRAHIAFRAGVLFFHGWSIPDTKVKEIARARRPVVDSDVQPDIKQKRVDMKIGLDVAWLASKRLVDRMVLVTGDTDFVPAMKFARREGIQVLLAVPDRFHPSQELVIHSDELREINFPPPMVSPPGIAP